MMLLQRSFAALSLTLGAIGAVPAQTSVPLANPSFEADAAPGGGFPVLLPDGWTLFDPGGIVNQQSNAVGVLRPEGTSFFTDPVPDGNNVALIYLEHSRGTAVDGPVVGLLASFNGVLQNFTRYTLTVSVGDIASGTGLGAFAPFGFADLSGFPGYQVQLLAGGVVVAEDDNSLASTITDGQFRTSTVVFETGAADLRAGSVLGVRVINLNAATGNLNERAREVDFDHVQLMAAAVPEPHEYALWLGGLALLMRLRKRYPERLR